MSLNYTTYIQALGGLMVISTTNADFLAMVPNCIDDAEQRIRRECDFLAYVTRDSSSTFATGTRSITLPSSISTFFVVNSIYAITPFGTSNPDAGTRNPLVPASRDWCDYTFPSSTGSTVPGYFSMTTQTTGIVAPWPDQAYQMEVVGTINPPPLSSTNVTTFLSVFLPDLLLAGSMVYAAAWQQNFGASGAVDNPQSPMTWEAHFQSLLKSAQVEEARKKFTSQGWSSKQPAQLATPPRT